jgi:hypothetical protein
MTQEEIQEKSENELGSIDYQVGFSQGAKWAVQTMMERTCKWLDSIAELTGYDSYNLIESYKKAMEK